MNECISGIFVGDKEAHEAFYLANTACETLEELASKDDGEPFCLRVDFGVRTSLIYQRKNSLNCIIQMIFLSMAIIKMT